jgi:hypothetical protein
MVQVVQDGGAHARETLAEHLHSPTFSAKMVGDRRERDSMVGGMVLTKLM